MEKKFIKLHTKDDKHSCIVNVQVINNVFYDTYNKTTSITFTTDNGNLDVVEDVETIYNLIYGKEI